MPDEGVGLPLNQMHRRHFLASLAAAAIPSVTRGADRPDFTLRIAPASLEIAPRKIVKTIAYNGSVPGPLLRVKEGQPVTIEVFNDTGDAEIVHWHGLQIPSAVDGAMEEGTPMIPAHASARYTFTPKPSGTRWYHTHGMAGRNLKRATYTGQFGFFYIDPRTEPGNYDQEVFLALKEWEPYFSSGGEGGDDSLDVAYDLFSINDRALGHGEPDPGERRAARPIANPERQRDHHPPHRYCGAQVSRGGDGRKSGGDA